MLGALVELGLDHVAVLPESSYKVYKPKVVTLADYDAKEKDEDAAEADAATALAAEADSTDNTTSNTATETTTTPSPDLGDKPTDADTDAVAMATTKAATAEREKKKKKKKMKPVKKVSKWAGITEKVVQAEKVREETKDYTTWRILRQSCSTIGFFSAVHFVEKLFIEAYAYFTKHHKPL